MPGFAVALRERYGVCMLEAAGIGDQQFMMLSDGVPGGMNFTRITARHVRGQRSALGPDRQEHVFLLLPVRGELLVEQYARNVRLAPGNFSFLDARAGCIVAAPDESECIVVDISRSAFGKALPPVHQLCGREIRPMENVGPLLVMLIETVYGWSCGRPENTAAAEKTILNLLRSELETWAASSDKEICTLVDQMHDWVIENIGCPDLTPALLADRFDLSRRTTYRLFERIGTTPMKWLWDLRLDHAHRQLELGRKSVTEVAFSSGFNDTAHFARLFKRRFGQPPNSLRRRPSLGFLS